MDDLVDLIYIPILIALIAFFAISEFAIVKLREPKIDQYLKEGKIGAHSAKKVYTKLEEYLSACRIGITATSVAVGLLGVPALKEILQKNVTFLETDWAINLFSAFIAFIIVASIVIVFGELAPKIVAIEKHERFALLLSGPLVFLYTFMYPVIWFLNQTARIFTSIFGIKTKRSGKSAHTEEELRMILSESFKSGEINQSEFQYVNNVFEFDNRIAKEIMVPRTEIICLDINDSFENILNIVRSEKLTRYPIIDGDKDHILGLINIKEWLSELILGEELSKQTIKSYIRPIIRVIDTIPIDELLVKMQREQIHMAVLMDEYGGTSGLVTVEDIVEELVGEIRDEFDLDEIPLIRQVSDEHYILDAKVLVNEINDLLSLELNDNDVDTIGGWILTEKFDIREGDSILFEDYRFKIVEMADHHIKYIEVTKVKNEKSDLSAMPIHAANTEAG